MPSVRPGRVGEQIKKELSQIIQYEFKDPRVGFVTITGVDVTGDLSQATIYLSVYGSEQQNIDTLKALTSGTGFMRSELGKRIRLRIAPKLIFKFDTSVEYGSKIEKLISQIHEEGKPAE